MSRLPLAALVLAAAATPALASTDDAWAAFRTEVETKCRDLVGPPKGARVMVEVSPEGSESYGVALVTVGLPGGGAERSVCVMDKHSRKAELATPLPATTGESAAVGGGMGKAQQKGPTAGDARAPAAKPVAKAEAAAKAEAEEKAAAEKAAAKTEAEMAEAAARAASGHNTQPGKTEGTAPAAASQPPAVPVTPPQPKPAG